jgi:hypothetical protein
MFAFGIKREQKVQKVLGKMGEARNVEKEAMVLI